MLEVLPNKNGRTCYRLNCQPPDDFFSQPHVLSRRQTTYENTTSKTWQEISSNAILLPRWGARAKATAVVSRHTDSPSTSHDAPWWDGGVTARGRKSSLKEHFVKIQQDVADNSHRCRLHSIHFLRKWSQWICRQLHRTVRIGSHLLLSVLVQHCQC